MNVFKSVTLTLALITTLAVASFSAYAQPIPTNTAIDQSQKLTSFSVPQKISSEEMASLRNQAVPASPSGTAKSASFNPNLVQLYYVFYDLYPGHFITSNGSITLSSTSDVDLTLVQWANDDSNSKVSLYYQLVSSGTDSEVIKVVGSYKAVNTTITFEDVPAGTYRVQITNDIDGIDAQGNGYIE
jgi:hypothetical protein